MQTSNFQIIVLGICTVLILVGIGVFASVGGFQSGAKVGRVVIWGTVPLQDMTQTIDVLHEQDKSFDNVLYVEKDAATYETTLVNAMANGTAPDLFIVGIDTISQFSDKIIPIPYNSFSQSNFLNSYIDEGQLFLTPNGSLALPFSVDPLVMYWNRDLFAGAGVASPPQYWNDFLELAPKITSLDSVSNVKRSTVALGEWRNIAHAKEILSTLFMQAGDQIVNRGQDGVLRVVFGTTPPNFPENPAESVLKFYSAFANPSKTSYSWNRALPRSTNAFTSGDLAVYFGYASEYQDLVARNPNIHISVALVPQIQGNATRYTYGRLTGLAIPRTSHNVNGAVLIASLLTSKMGSATFSEKAGLPSVRRDVPANTASNAAATVFLQSALFSRGWLDPNPKATDTLFQNMIESVVSSKNSSSEAVLDAAQEMGRLIPSR